MKLCSWFIVTHERHVFVIGVCPPLMGSFLTSVILPYTFIFLDKDLKIVLAIHCYILTFFKVKMFSQSEFLQVQLNLQSSTKVVFNRYFALHPLFIEIQTWKLFFGFIATFWTLFDKKMYEYLLLMFNEKRRLRNCVISRFYKNHRKN